MLLIAASDSEGFSSGKTSSLPLSGEEACPSLTYLKLLDVMSCTVDKLSLEWRDMAQAEMRFKLDDCFLAGHSMCPPQFMVGSDIPVIGSHGCSFTSCSAGLVPHEVVSTATKCAHLGILPTQSE